MGTFGIQTIGKQKFRDVANGLTATVEFGSYFLKKQDYIWGEIYRGTKKVSEITGNYTSHLDFNAVRYWDYREEDIVQYPIVARENFLPSDARNRTDG